MYLVCLYKDFKKLCKGCIKKKKCDGFMISLHENIKHDGQR